MGLFKKNLPPKTTIDNLIELPHLERVLLWFLQNDAEMQIINSEAVRLLFNESIRPSCDVDNDPDIFAKEVDNPKEAKPIERWLIVKTWLDLIKIMREAQELVENEKGDTPVIKIFEERIDNIEKQATTTLIICGEMISKYNINAKLDMDLTTELLKIKNPKDKEIFKYNYLVDSLLSSEVRLLAWIYRELFGKDYKIKK